MIAKSHHVRVLDPLERFSEIVFGLIMVLTFTCVMGISPTAREDVHAMFIGAIGCNLAWGVIDAAFYLISCLTERRRAAWLLQCVQQASTSAQGQQTIAEALPDKVAEAMDPTDYDRLYQRLKALPAPLERPGLTLRDWRGALGVFLLVFLSTFPVVLPFAFVHDARQARFISNLIAVAMLFAAGHMLARHANLHRFLTGASMVLIGGVMVALTIALGG